MEHTVYQVWWASAGCLPDSDTPAFEADTRKECEAWLATDEASEYWESVGDYNTYSFQIHANTSTGHSWLVLEQTLTTGKVGK